MDESGLATAGNGSKTSGHTEADEAGRNGDEGPVSERQSSGEARGGTADATTPEEASVDSAEGDSTDANSGVLRVVDTLETEHWTGVAAAAALALGLGAILESEALVLLAVVGVGYAAHARAGDPPVVSLRVDRELSDATPDSDEEVRVTVSVTNTGETTLADLRLVDGVPPGLAVTDGTARFGTALRPGKTARFAYTVTAVRGTHDWEPLTAIARDAAGSNERVVEVEADTTLRCAPALDAASSLPLRGLTTPYSGQVGTDVGGPGLEFHATRQYRHGDPLNRIDWNRYARTGDLSTLQYRQERAATVVLLVDSREEAYVASDPEAANAVERGTDAAGQAFSALLSTGDRAGLAAFGPEECWLAPSTGEEHRARARDLLASHPAFSVTPSEGTFFPTIWLRRFRRRLPADAQVVVFSPLADDHVTSVIRRLDAHGHLVTVISPDPTAADTVGHRLARLERRERVRSLRSAGVRVVDWGDRPLAVALAKATRRWSR